MENERIRVANWISGLLARISPASRRKLARQIGINLRRSQSSRIGAQRNPDGSAYTPRKNRKRIRDTRGRLKQQRASMFQRLRKTSRMVLATNENQISISFLKSISRTASVHHFGLEDRVSPHGPTVRYPARRLLGFSQADEQLIRDAVLRHLKE